MSVAERAIAEMLQWEGGYVVDHAGPTHRGITLRSLRGSMPDGTLEWDLDGDGDVDAADLLAMTHEQAVAWYKEHFWVRFGHHHLAEPGPRHERCAAYAFDCCVNMGQRQSGRILQRALVASGRRQGVFDLVVDGLVGPKTLTAYRAADARVLLTAQICERAAFYRLLVARVPAHEQYLKGWLNRTYGYALP